MPDDINNETPQPDAFDRPEWWRLHINQLYKGIENVAVYCEEMARRYEEHGEHGRAAQHKEPAFRLRALLDQPDHKFSPRMSKSELEENRFLGRLSVAEQAVRERDEETAGLRESLDEWRADFASLQAARSEDIARIRRAFKKIDSASGCIDGDLQAISGLQALEDALDEMRAALERTGEKA